MEACTHFRWNEKHFKPIKNIKLNENRTYCVTLSLVYEKDDKGKIIDKPILSLKRWRRRRDENNNLYFQPSRGFNIRNEEQFSGIRGALSQYDGKIEEWKSGTTKPPIKPEFYNLVVQSLKEDPKTVLKLLNEIEKYVGKKDKDDIDFINALKIVNSIDKELLTIFSKLTEQTPESLKEMNNLLDSLSLTQINAFTKWVQIRLDALEIFHKLIVNKKTYEIKGKLESMHLFLEDNSWILGEEYELYTSNKTLKTNIAKKMGKKLNIKHGSKRPDFALVNLLDKTLMIIEIKKPGYSLKLNDVTQLMIYKSVSKKYMPFSSFKAFLIGGEMSEDLQENKDGFRDVHIKTYTQIISNTKNRYKEIYDVYKKKKIGSSADT